MKKKIRPAIVTMVVSVMMLFALAVFYRYMMGRANEKAKPTQTAQATSSGNPAPKPEPEPPKPEPEATPDEPAEPWADASPAPRIAPEPVEITLEPAILTHVAPGEATVVPVLVSSQLPSLAGGQDIPPSTQEPTNPGTPPENVAGTTVAPPVLSISPAPPPLVMSVVPLGTTLFPAMETVELPAAAPMQPILQMGGPAFPKWITGVPLAALVRKKGSPQDAVPEPAMLGVLITGLGFAYSAKRDWLSRLKKSKAFNSASKKNCR